MCDSHLRDYSRVEFDEGQLFLSTFRAALGEQVGSNGKSIFQLDAKKTGKGEARYQPHTC